MRTLLCEVQSGGLLTTIQDLGRSGYRQFGVPVSGVMDPVSAVRANQLVSNSPGAPVLEITQTGPKLHFKKYGALAITGANLSPKLNSVSVNNNETIFFSKGDVLTFGPPTTGIRAYLAFSGELEGESLFGSKSTHIGNGWGGLEGRALSGGDQLFIVPHENHIRALNLAVDFKTSKTIRISKCLEFEGLDDTDKNMLFNQQWTITSESNRMGIRLTGIALQTNFPELISSPTDTGIIQLPPNGQPIILMNDSAAVGGYPRIGAVRQEDISKLAQKPPGASIQLKLVN